VESEVGGGSSFRICLPLATEKDSVDDIPVKPRCRGTETILLAEDDKLVLQASKSMLEENGYRVIPARGGVEAVELFRKESDTNCPGDHRCRYARDERQTGV